MVSIPACHAGDRGSIPRRGDIFIPFTISLVRNFNDIIFRFCKKNPFSLTFSVFCIFIDLSFVSLFPCPSTVRLSFNCNPSLTVFLSPGAVFKNYLSQICKIFVTLGLNILRLLKLYVFLKQRSLDVNVNYNKNSKMPIF